MIVEDEHFPAFRRFTRPWQIRPWQRQQIIKLDAPALTPARFVLTLDPDVVARRPITRDLLLPGGRASLEPEARGVHRAWWRASADLLDVDPGLERVGMNVTPAVLSIAVIREVQKRLEAVGNRPWMEILLTSYCEWTEYSLYLAEGAQWVMTHSIQRGAHRPAWGISCSSPRPWWAGRGAGIDDVAIRRGGETVGLADVRVESLPVIGGT